jgi:hypothetical protein
MNNAENRETVHFGDRRPVGANEITKQRSL